MENILITGSNRGIGLAVTKQYLQQGNAVIFAACRKPDTAESLQELKSDYPDNLHVIPLEVTDSDSIAQAVEAVKAHTAHLNVLINNAAINTPQQAFPQIEADNFMKVLEVNTVAPLMVTKAFYELLAEGENTRVVNISSGMGSLEQRTSGNDYAYCASKAGLNMVMRGMAADLMQYGNITVISLDPGWVRTDMGGESASLAPETSAQGIVNVVSALTPADNGRFLVWDGSEQPW